MRIRLYQRLHRLEAEQTRARICAEVRDREAHQESIRTKLEALLRRCGVERTDAESLFDAFARALGTVPKELRAQLRAGINPIQRLFEAIDRRKAAGEWPAAEGMRGNVRL